MSFFHILRVLFAVILAGVTGWISLFAFNFVRVWQRFEAFEATARDSDLGAMSSAVEEALQTIQGGSAVFLAATIAGVLLGEVFKSRSLVFYAGATGALTAALAAAFWQQAGAFQSAVSALAMAGFVAGAVYWTIASPSGSQR